MRLEDPGLIMAQMVRLRFLSAADSRITCTIEDIYFGSLPLATGYFLLAIFPKKNGRRGSHRGRPGLTAPPSCMLSSTA
jgi:hypothetical protein